MTPYDAPLADKAPLAGYGYIVTNLEAWFRALLRPPRSPPDLQGASLPRQTSEDAEWTRRNSEYGAASGLLHIGMAVKIHMNLL